MGFDAERNGFLRGAGNGFGGMMINDGGSVVSFSHDNRFAGWDAARDWANQEINQAPHERAAQISMYAGPGGGGVFRHYYVKIVKASGRVLLTHHSGDHSVFLHTAFQYDVGYHSWEKSGKLINVDEHYTIQPEPNPQSASVICDIGEDHGISEFSRIIEGHNARVRGEPRMGLISMKWSETYPSELEQLVNLPCFSDVCFHGANQQKDAAGAQMFRRMDEKQEYWNRLLRHGHVSVGLQVGAASSDWLVEEHQQLAAAKASRGLDLYVVKTPSGGSAETGGVYGHHWAANRS